MLSKEEIEKAIEENNQRLVRYLNLIKKIKIRKMKLENKRLKKQYEKIKNTKKYKRALKKGGKKLRKQRSKYGI